MIWVLYALLDYLVHCLYWNSIKIYLCKDCNAKNLNKQWHWMPSDRDLKHSNSNTRVTNWSYCLYNRIQYSTQNTKLPRMIFLEQSYKNLVLEQIFDVAGPKGYLQQRKKKLWWNTVISAVYIYTLYYTLFIYIYWHLTLYIYLLTL